MTGGYTLNEVLDYLNRHRVRATYKAVGDVIGVYHRNVGRELEDRSPRTSWVVRARDGKPSGYTDDMKHPHLCSKTHVIKPGGELGERLDEARRVGEQAP